MNNTTMVANLQLDESTKSKTQKKNHIVIIYAIFHALSHSLTFQTYNFLQHLKHHETRWAMPLCVHLHISCTLLNPSHHSTSKLLVICASFNMIG